MDADGWHRVSLVDLPSEGRVRSVTVDGRTLAMARCGGSLSALENRCPHQGGPLGEAGPGPSYLDPGSGGPENDFTNRNTTFMTWNLLHLARIVKEAGGIPAHGNQRSEWEAGCRFDFDNPDYR